MSLTATAQTLPAKVHTNPLKTAVSPKAATNVSLGYVLGSLYTKASTDTGHDNYYFIVSDQSSASYNSSSAKIEATNAHIVMFDLYAPNGSGSTLPEGTYKFSTSNDNDAEYYYDANYSAGDYYDADGKGLDQVPAFTGDITVSRATNGSYTITATNIEGTTYTFNGTLSFTGGGSTTVYPQITSDISTTFTGGLAYYYGNLYESKTGNIYINLYDCAFSTETGGMQEKGIDLAICAFGRLFGDPDNATITPGTYTVARNFAQNTYFPGMEVDYMSTTIVMGTYVKRRKAVTGADSDYDYGYITDGTITITEGEEAGTFDFVVDCTTDRGHKVTGTGKNISFTIINNSEDDKKSADSNLDHDVKLDLDYIKTARAYYLGEQNGVNVFWVDLGSPSGKDGDEGDLLRMEFQTSTGLGTVPAGTYTMMEYDHNYTNLYAPYKMTQGYYYNGGELTGTRYWHFKKGSYQVVDTFASVISGTVGVEVLENNEYKFTIDLADGRDYFIQGQWQGPVQLNYDPATAINRVEDEKQGRVRLVGSDQLSVSGLTDDDTVLIYSADGQLLRASRGSSAIDISRLGTGVYIVKAGNKATTKFVKK